MSKIKYTKNELKAQRDGLRRFQRYLPTLLLKKQQLQVELRQIEARLEEQAAEERRLRAGLESWLKLWSEPVDLDGLLRVEEIRTSTGNIAGVTIPVLEEIRIRREVPDLFATPSWVDDALDVLAKLLRLSAEGSVLREQHACLAAELRTTSQRVNLFEKIKIPECEENIRVIRIFLGDQQTAEVARAKLAKGRSKEEVAA